MTRDLRIPSPSLEGRKEVTALTLDRRAKECKAPRGRKEVERTNKWCDSLDWALRIYFSNSQPQRELGLREKNIML